MSPKKTSAGLPVKFFSFSSRVNYDPTNETATLVGVTDKILATTSPVVNSDSANEKTKSEKSKEMPSSNKRQASKKQTNSLKKIKTEKRGRIKPVRMAELKMCGICCGSICDRYIMRVADTSYHERCLLCSVCGIRLSHTCFTRDSKLYCRLDYDRLYAKKCLGCSERISADELVMRALDSVFHLRCFICVVCGARLQRGDQFVIKQGQLFCRPDYEKEVEMLQGYAQDRHPRDAIEERIQLVQKAPFPDGLNEQVLAMCMNVLYPNDRRTVPRDFTCDDLLQSSRTQDGRRGPKRPRTILTTQQRKAFKASFEVSPKPCRKVREALAKDTGLSVRIVQGPKRQHTMLTTQQREAFKEYFRLCPKPGCKVREGLAKETGLSARIVQVWFQNQRAKMKKIQKKARQESKNKDGDSGDDRKPKLKEEDSSPTGTFLNEDSDTNNTLPTSENYLHSNSGSEEHLQYLPIKEEMLENEESPFLKMSAHGEHHRSREFVSDGGGHEKMNSGFLGFPYSGSPLEQPPAAHQIFINQAPPLGLNPIDRLYSMQNSYFCGEDSTMVDQ